jgi:hypothetical protein
MKRALPFLVILAALSAIGVWLFVRNNPHGNALKVRELATQRLAEHLAQTYPGQRALLISNPFTQNGATAKDVVAMEQAGIDGVRKGLGTKLTLEAIAFPDLKPEARANPRALLADSETTTPISYLVTDDAFDKLLSQHPNCTILISLVGFPAALQDIPCWKDEKTKFVMLLPDLRFVGDAIAVKRAVQSGKLAAFVLHKPGAPDSRSMLKRPDEFDQRFLLVSRENIERMMADYPQLFPAK